MSTTSTRLALVVLVSILPIAVGAPSTARAGAVLGARDAVRIAPAACGDNACPDHFLCYKTKPVKAPSGAPPFPQLAPTSVGVTDRLGGPFPFDVKKSLTLCAPANKAGEDPTAPAHPGHLVGYQAKRGKSAAKFARKNAIVDAHNQLHPDGLKLKITGEDRLLVASSKVLGTGGNDQAAPADLADFKCYKVAPAKAPRGQVPFPKFTPRTGVVVEDQLFTRIYDLKKATRVCFADLDPGEQAPDDDAPAHLVCYQARFTKLPKQAKTPPQKVSTRNTLAEEVRATATPDELCIPSSLPPTADDLMRAIDTVEAQTRLANENFPILIRPAIEALYPEAVALIAQGPAALDRIFAEFAPRADILDDLPLSILAYVLEQIGDERAIPVLADWLERHLFAEMVWAPDFVTHALKVLDGQDGLDTFTYVYDIDAKLDALAQARGSAAAMRASRATLDIAGATRSPSADASLTASPSSSTAGDALARVMRARVATAADCPKKITVRGVNGLGQPDEFSFNYTVVARDLDQRIADETDPAKKQALQKFVKEQYLDPDEQAYGGTPYVPLPGAGVSAISNCGGSVAERTLNVIAMQKGLPLRLGPGRSSADEIREVARRFGNQVAFNDIDRATVISHDRAGDSSAHVEVAEAATPGVGASVYSKDNFGIARSHQVKFSDGVDVSFKPPRDRYEARSWFPFASAGTHFYKIDPNRVTEIVVDSSACPCTPNAPGSIPVAITSPTDPTTTERVLTVSGTVGDQTVTAGTLRVNSSPQALAVSGGTFAAQVVLQNGDNSLNVTVDSPDGRIGCATRSIKSTAPKTTISATLTWNLADADVDLYVTQPDAETSWYRHKTTAIGGRLDVDNTHGFGPENYFLSAAAGNTVLPGDYTIRVHYYDDARADDQTPTRTVGWRVVVVVNEATPEEHREVKTGTIGLASSANDAPGSSGADWATATVITIPMH